MLGSEEDLALFYQTDDFAEEVEVRPATGAPFALTVIFDAPVVDEGLRASSLPYSKGAAPASNAPHFRCLTASFPNAGRMTGGRGGVVVRGREHIVNKAIADGTGETFVELKVRVD